MIVLTAVGPGRDDPMRLLDLIRTVLRESVARRISMNAPIETRSGTTRASNGCSSPDQTPAALNARLDAIEERLALRRLRTDVTLNDLRGDH
jgi:hypothetical protein